MFVITEVKPHGFAATQIETNDIKDIFDIVLNITNDEKEALHVMKMASNMSFGDGYRNERYKLECVNKNLVMDSKNFNIEVAKDMVRECERHLAKLEYNDRFLASDIDEAISGCIDELKEIIDTYGE